MGSSTMNILYIVISSLVVVFDVGIAAKVFAHKKNYSHVLGCTCLASGLVQVVYLLSVLSDHYFYVSFFSSMYFISISFAVLLLLTFIRAHSQRNNRKIRAHGFFKYLMGVWFVVDAILFLINPFAEIMVHYAYVGGRVAKYAFVFKPLYWTHLVYVYLMVLVVVIHLIYRAVTVPREYRKQYIATIVSILFVVALNALVLFFPTLFGNDALDYSLWGYSIASFALYVNFFRYPSKGMKNYYHAWIVENVNQGVVLFNFENNLIIHNDKVHSIFEDADIHDGMTIQEFSEQLSLEIRDDRSIDDYSFQHYIKRGDREVPVRFDHRCLKNVEGKILGQLFVFTDEIGETDLLTSFYGWEKFKQILTDAPEIFEPPVTIAVCDINGLGDINVRMGKSVGDQAIKLLAGVIRKHFAGESYYVRGQEASLIVISFDLNSEQVRERLKRVHEEILGITELGCIINIQSAIGVVDEQNRDVLAVVKQAFQSMKNRKLLDVKSRRSELVTSLVKTLAECDNDTEAHVRRTQIMGEELGKRLGLTDVQQSDLALLCILHDIGKIGIPLEILNKPGKLSDPEWRMMRTHTEKGYQIATSSQELSHIADMILHHHECWDGHGYPDGLTKESIPLLSRIISVVDSYDAMVNDRVYRPALSVEDAIKELKRCSGTQFDPSIVNEFIRMLPEIGEVDQDKNLDLLNVPAETEVQVLDDKSKETSGKKTVHSVRYSRYVLNEKMRIIYVDEAFEHITGYSREDIQNNVITQQDLLPEEDRTEYMRLVSEQLSHSSLAFFEHRLKCKDGHILYVFCNGKVYYDSAEKAERSEILVFDSAETYAMRVMLKAEKVKAEARLAKWEDKYRCDSLTGLLSHEAFKNDIEHRLSSSSAKVMLIMMDVDKFKNYNDTYGHRAGDEFLIRLSHALTETLRKDDLACRMGGDEFAAALFYTDVVDDSVMFDRAQQICDKLNIMLNNQKGGTSLSMGVVVSDDTRKAFNTLYENADTALYEAKESGRARMVVYNKN